MACKTICKLCDHLVVSTGVSITSGVGLIIRLPSGSYANGEKYCLVIAQAIPDAATINMPVYITIGTETTVYYPLNKCDCTQATASGIRTRTRYSTRVATTPEGGVFKLLGKINCYPENNLPAIGD